MSARKDSFPAKEEGKIDLAIIFIVLLFPRWLSVRRNNSFVDSINEKMISLFLNQSRNHFRVHWINTETIHSKTESMLLCSKTSENRFGQDIQSFNISTGDSVCLELVNEKIISLLLCNWVNAETIYSKTESRLRGNISPIQCKVNSFLLWEDTCCRNWGPPKNKIIWKEKPTFSSIFAARSKDPRQTRYNWGSWIQKQWASETRKKVLNTVFRDHVRRF